MTTPVERMLAVVAARVFLEQLADPKVSPAVPAYARNRAAQLLRHYPVRVEIEEAFALECYGAKPEGMS